MMTVIEWFFDLFALGQDMRNESRGKRLTYALWLIFFVIVLAVFNPF